MWHPGSESEASCELTALLEFLRATKGLCDLTPQALWDWYLRDATGFAEAFAEYDPTANTAERISAVFASHQSVIASAAQQ